MEEYVAKIYLDIDTKYRCNNVIINSFYKREDAEEFLDYITNNFKTKAYSIAVRKTLLYEEK